MPISGIGGIENWRDAAEFMALGGGTVQVCTAAMVYGFKIVEEMISGLEALMDEKGYTRVDDFVGRAVPRVTDWQHLNLEYVVKARIDQDLCIKCGRCHIACEDTSHQAITLDEERRAPLRSDRRGMRRLQSVRMVCPVENCITLEPMPDGASIRAPACKSAGVEHGKNTRTIRRLRGEGRSFARDATRTRGGRY